MTPIEEEILVSTLGNLIRPYVSMLMFVRESAPRTIEIVNNATISFVDTGSAKLLVTNSHVLQAFKEKRANDPSIRMVIGGTGGNSLELQESSLIENYQKTDLKIDLATFRVSPTEEIQNLGKKYFQAKEWPPIAARKGELLLVIGYPGKHRGASGTPVKAVMTVILEPVTSVQDGYFTLADEFQERIVVKLDKSLGGMGSLGGMSGSAAYIVDDNREPRLVGFLSEAQEGDNAQIRFLHASFIKHDGKLDYTRIF